ncbi:MAG: Acetylornithine/acetyl-lysine aminotransferase [Candidatus Heimdallarchaeota archaeon LC_2]|nr:MAG: Acetylornithine/acetyl-lysine aminotransferase [Candidatus Heimdallarchaeota archaeon LC_2]
MRETNPITDLNTQEIFDSENSLEIPIYMKREIAIVQGDGAIVYDSNGEKYIDCVSGIGVASVGHSNSDVVKAITNQASKIITTPEIFYNDTRAQLLKLLNKITPTELTQIFLCNSGTEAIEAAIKFTKSTTGKSEFISMVRGFHGRTIGALSASFNKHYKDDFEPLLTGFHFVPFNNFSKLIEKVNENTAGIIVELIQGNGGVHIAKQEFILKIRELCNEKGIMLIFDEVQTGFCRTGYMFALEKYGIIPDILCLAKAMGGGIPIGATICSSKIEIGLSKHGSTFGGNPLACAASIATIQFMLDNKLSQQAQEKGEYFLRKLQSLELRLIRKIRQEGLLIGIECKQKVGNYIIELQNNGLLVNSAGSNVIRLLPPLVISYEQLDLVIEKLSVILN